MIAYRIPPMFEGKNGYVEVKLGDRILYSGYYLNGRLFILSAPALGKVWYKGLLSEVEYESERLGNPMRYAHEKYGDRYIKHLEAFTREVLREVKERFAGENLKTNFVPMAEEHVREILGIPLPRKVEGVEAEESEDVEELRLTISADTLEAHLKSLHYLDYYINGKGTKELATYLDICEAIKHEDTSFLLIHPHRIVLVGRIGPVQFVGVAPGIKVATATLLYLYEKCGSTSPPSLERLPVGIFREVGIPVAKVLLTDEDRVKISLFRHIGTMVKVDKEVETDLETFHEMFNRWHEWIDAVLYRLRLTPPSRWTKRAWSKLIEAYLEDFPHPLDFERILKVEALSEAEIPRCEGLTRLYASDT